MGRLLITARNSMSVIMSAAPQFAALCEKGGKIMQGITMEELNELISHCHEAEFEYKGTTYVLQPEVNEGKAYLVIWDCTPDSAKCICKHEIGDWGDIPQAVIDAVLSDKCFDGKSFLEIEKDITVTVIY